MIKEIDRAEIRKLPEGSIVREHSVGRDGIPQYLDITVHHTDDGKVEYYCKDYRGFTLKTKLRGFKIDSYHYYELLKRGDKT